MRKAVIILIVLLLLISACTKCPENKVKIGDECCYDEDSNKVCDYLEETESDEADEEPEDLLEPGECPEGVMIRLDDACLKDGKLSVDIYNSGSVGIDKLHIGYFSDEEHLEEMVDNKLAPRDSYNNVFEAYIGEVSGLTITPVVTIYQEDASCDGAAIEVSDLSAC